MSFEKIPNPFYGRTKESVEGRSRIEGYLKEIAEQMRAMGVPVGKDLRLQPQEYAGKVYPNQEVELDLKSIEEKKQGFNEERRERAELCEKYTVALFNKHFSGKLIAVRTSEYDDIFRHVDTLVVDRTTGQAICAVDEVSAMQGEIYEQKREKVKRRNVGEPPGRGGAKIKYGLNLRRNEKGQEHITLDHNSHLPIFYVAISKEALTRAVSDFSPSTDNTSQYEKQMLQYILTSIKAQIEGLKLEEAKLNPVLKSSLSRFETIIEEIDSKP